MAEQILHGSNVVTAAEQGRRERVAEGVRCGGLRDACLFYGTFEGALKGLVIHVMATHDTAPWIGRMRVLRKAEPRRECPARGYFRSRASESATPLRPSAWSFSHHARARDGCSRRLGAKLSGNIKARSRSPCPPHDDRAVIEIQILDPQLQTLTDPHARSIQKLGEQTMLAFQKTEDANHSSRVSTTGKRRDGRGLPIS